MSSNGKITDEAEYENSLNWMVEKAVILEDPLLDPVEREKQQRLYDFVEQRIHEYKRGCLVRLFPGLREQYRILGLKYQELEPRMNEPEPVTAAQDAPVVDTPAAPKMPPAKAVSLPAEQPKASANLSSWLDD